jgi:hypothetical protein
MRGPIQRPQARGRRRFAKALVEERGKVSDQKTAVVKAAGWTDANLIEMIALTAQFLPTTS